MLDELLDNSPADPSTADAPTAQPAADPIVSAPADVAPPAWPDNWRQVMAGGDEKELKRLERMKTPADVYKSYREIEKIKSSFTPPPKAPTAESTPEEIKAYRDHYGVPEDHTKYDLNFEDGTAIGDDVMPVLEGYLKYAHERNRTPAQVKEDVKWYMEDMARAQEQIQSMNNEAEQKGKAELKAEWGPNYKGNFNAINSLFVDAPAGVKEALMLSRGDDGLMFGNKTDNIRWLVNIANQLNPTASLVPSGANDAASIDTELDKYRGWMNSKDPVERNKYWKDDSISNPVTGRFAQLNAAKAQMKSR